MSAMRAKRSANREAFSDLEKFLVQAKGIAYGTDSKEKDSACEGFRETEFSNKKYRYLHSYAGFKGFDGRECVWLRGKDCPVWTMSYRGGINARYLEGDHAGFIEQTYRFMIKAICKLNEEKPFRGPEEFIDGPFKYSSFARGDIDDFEGKERIIYEGRKVYEARFFGGFVFDKEPEKRY